MPRGSGVLEAFQKAHNLLLTQPPGSFNLPRDPLIVPVPDERHYGREKEILARRQCLYERARRANPDRWTSATRNWTPVTAMTLNPTGVSELPDT